MTDTFDYVIVGAGSAGCVLTNRLSEDAGTSICVLEAGPSDWHPYIHLPAGFIKTFHMKGINWAYQQEPGPWTGGRSIYAPRGKTLGGSSSINGHTSTIGASARISIPGHSSAIAAGAIRMCCPISSGWSGASARARTGFAGATAI
jgi:choline dehydrogenase-like flavoprotein